VRNTLPRQSGLVSETRGDVKAWGVAVSACAEKLANGA
jgi:hypothetical protein